MAVNFLLTYRANLLKNGRWSDKDAGADDVADDVACCAPLAHFVVPFRSGDAIFPLRSTHFGKESSFQNGTGRDTCSRFIFFYYFLLVALPFLYLFFNQLLFPSLFSYQQKMNSEHGRAKFRLSFGFTEISLLFGFEFRVLISDGRLNFIQL